MTLQRLVVRNVTGIAEERGFRLYWQDVVDGKPTSIIVPALGLATSNPFRTERAAKDYGSAAFGVLATRLRN